MNAQGPFVDRERKLACLVQYHRRAIVAKNAAKLNAGCSLVLMGLHSRRVPTMTPVHCQKCLQCELLNCDMKQWKKVVWSDESCLDQLDGWVCVRCLLGEEMAAGCTMRRRQVGGCIGLLWAIFCWETLGFMWILIWQVPKDCCRPFQ